MHTRVTTFTATDISAIEAKLAEISAKVAAIPGVKRMQAVWTGAGQGQVMATYEDQAAATAGQAHAAAIWGSLMPYLAGEPETTEFDRGEIMI